jgi:predicted RNA-binding protein YlxR (DUF448 family)
MEKKIPMRMCIACKTMKPKKELIRVVKSGEEIFLDKTGKANGRGAYVCNDGECIKKLNKQKLINRAFGLAVEQEVYDRIEESFFGKEN